MNDHPRVLVVDDVDNIPNSTGAILTEAGYIVDLVESGKEAIQLSKKAFYNVALIDIRLQRFLSSEY